MVIGIVLILSLREPLRPLSRLRTYEIVEISFKTLVDHFTLSTGLRMVGQAKFQFSPNRSVQKLLINTKSDN